MSNPTNDKAAKSDNKSSGSARNPFASRSSSSKPSSTPSAPAGSSSRSRFGTFASRFGAQKRLEWRIAPLNGALVRFDLNGLGDPFHRILGTPMNMAYGNLQDALAAVQAGEVPLDELTAKLNASWENFALKGVVLIFEWQDRIRNLVVSSAPMPAGELEDDDAEEKTDTGEDLSINPGSKPVCYRALDPALVINVLARTRAQILLPETPLAIEAAFLERTLVTDDAHLLALARATGSIQEAW